MIRFFPIGTNARSAESQPRFGGLQLALMLLLACAAVGCSALDVYDTSLERPTPPPMEPPRELAMCSLPAYHIEPPDILQIELMKMVPLPPYHIESYDVLTIQVLGTLYDAPINNYFMVEAEGQVNLGPAYGEVQVAGMTIEQATEAIRQRLLKTLRQPEVSIELARASGMAPVTGTYLVGPDGTVNLRQYGAVRVAGMTVTEAKLCVERHLERYFDSPEVSVDVAAYNSKVYYVVTQGANMGDNVVRVPVTGNETVLDAVSQVQGLSQVSSKKIWIARPAPGGFGCEQILPVDWTAITRGANTETNYQLLPGDRIFIAQDPMVAFNNFLARIKSPFEPVLGFGGLTVSTIRSFKSISVPTTY